MHDTSKPAVWTDQHLRTAAAAVAAELSTAAAAQDLKTTASAGSIHRGLPESLRARFIEVRAAFFQRGVYDPLLVRFDSATVSQAPTAEIAERLARVAESFGSVTV